MIYHYVYQHNAWANIICNLIQVYTTKPDVNDGFCFACVNRDTRYRKNRNSTKIADGMLFNMYVYKLS